MPSNQGSRRGTLASIAADLGVSRTTVSNAYNRPDQLSPVLRAKILAAAKARGYPGPDPTARSLRAGRTGTIGVLLTEKLSYAFEDHASVDFLAGLAESSYGTEDMLTLVPVGSEEHEDSSALVNKAVVDGFVVYSTAAHAPNLKAVVARGVPLVVCDQPYDTEWPYVGIDDFAAIAPAAQALIDAGHRHIGILAKRLISTRPRGGAVTYQEVETADLHVQRARIQGALAVFEKAGIDPASVPIVTRHHNDHQAAVDGARELLESHPELTAVLCTTDSMALGVLDYARDRVPSDLSVTGFDGVEIARTRGLSTVIQPNRAKGAAAGNMLHKLIDARLSGKQIATPRKILKTTFSPGTTVAAPPERG